MTYTYNIILKFFIHLISFVVDILVKFYNFTEPFVPNLKTKTVVPELTTRDTEYCCVIVHVTPTTNTAWWKYAKIHLWLLTDMK